MNKNINKNENINRNRYLNTKINTNVNTKINTKINTNVKVNINNKKINILKFFFDLETNIQLYHWMTESYPRHKASDKLFENITETIDKFIEVYIGIYGRPKINQENIIVKKMNDTQFITYLKKIMKFLDKELPKYFNLEDTDLFTIRDDMLIHINQALYLFTLH